METSGMSFMIMLLGLAFIVIEFKLISFIVKKSSLYIKLNRPLEVIVLIIIEIMSLLFVLTNISTLSPFYIVIILISLCVKVIGLWLLKRWVLFAYIIPGLLFQFIDVKTLHIRLDTTTTLMGLLFQSVIFLFYYLNVYYPNKKVFK